MTIRAGLLRQIGAIPEKIVIQADEYLFTLAATIAVGQILPEPLTYYRVHDANGFFTFAMDPRRERIRQESLPLWRAASTNGLSNSGSSRASVTKLLKSPEGKLTGRA